MRPPLKSLVLPLAALAALVTLTLAYQSWRRPQLIPREVVANIRHGCTFPELVAALGPPRNATPHDCIPPLHFSTGSGPPETWLGTELKGQWYFRNAVLSAYFTRQGRLSHLLADRPRFYAETASRRALLLLDAALLMDHVSEDYVIFPSQCPAPPWRLGLVLAAAWLAWLTAAALQGLPIRRRTAAFALSLCGTAAYLDGPLYPTGTLLLGWLHVALGLTLLTTSLRRQRTPRLWDT